MTERPVDSDFNLERWCQVASLRSRRVGIDQDAVDDLRLPKHGAVRRGRWPEPHRGARTGSGLQRTRENARKWIVEYLPRRRAGRTRRRVVEHPPPSWYRYLPLTEGHWYPASRCCGKVDCRQRISRGRHSRCGKGLRASERDERYGYDHHRRRAQLHCLHAPMKPRPVRFAYDDYAPRL